MNPNGDNMDNTYRVTLDMQDRLYLDQGAVNRSLFMTLLRMDLLLLPGDYFFGKIIPLLLGIHPCPTQLKKETVLILHIASLYMVGT